MARSGFKMKGSPMHRNFGIGSPIKKEPKPTKAQILDAANNPNNPMHPDNQGMENYLAWKTGSSIAPKATQRDDIYHAEGGKMRRFSDDSVDEEATEENVAHLQ